MYIGISPCKKNSIDFLKNYSPINSESFDVHIQNGIKIIKLLEILKL